MEFSADLKNSSIEFTARVSKKCFISMFITLT